jgi:hypothetical protein
MTSVKSLHERLMDRLSDEELFRKSALSRRRDRLFTQEELDSAKRRAKRIRAILNDEEDKLPPEKQKESA